MPTTPDRSTLTVSEVEEISLAVISEEYHNKGGAIRLDNIETPTLNMTMKSSASAFPAKGGYKVIVKDNRKGALQTWSGRDLLTFDSYNTIFELQYGMARVHMGDEWISQQLEEAGIAVEYDTSNGKLPGGRMTSATWEVAVNLAKSKVEDLRENWQRRLAHLQWTDNSSDTKAPDGIDNLLPIANTTGSIGGKSRTNPLLQHHVRAISGLDTLELDLMQVRRAANKRNGDGSRTDFVVCGETIYDKMADLWLGTSTRAGKFDRNLAAAQAQEMAAKWGIGIPDDAFAIPGVGIIMIEPLFEDLDQENPGLSVPFQKRMYGMNRKHIAFKAPKGKDGKTTVHPMPYNQRIHRVSTHGEYCQFLTKPNAFWIAYDNI